MTNHSTATTAIRQAFEFPSALTTKRAATDLRARGFKVAEDVTGYGLLVETPADFTGTSAEDVAGAHNGHLIGESRAVTPATPAKRPRTNIEIYVPDHGYFSTSPDGLDLAMVRYLPASIKGLRELCEYRTGLDFSAVDCLSTFLIILADFDS